MEETIKVEIKNIEGKLIQKEVPKSLLSLYLNGGWKLVQNKPKETKFMPKFETNDK
ncbi:MAG: hypothetical protein SOZ53_05150 [Candidatus Onthovivens sp.]|nr:hypothetical protein [Candidatus Onthovivens sp.]MDY3827996.1 hypothetical protein [Clostridium sp.]